MASDFHGTGEPHGSFAAQLVILVGIECLGSVDPTGSLMRFDESRSDRNGRDLDSK